MEHLSKRHPQLRDIDLKNILDLDSYNSELFSAINDPSEKEYLNAILETVQRKLNGIDYKLSIIAFELFVLIGFIFYKYILL